MRYLNNVLPVVFLSAFFNTMSSAAESVEYVAVLPQVKARALPVDPQKGYLVKEVKPDVFVITDGIYQSAFVTTGKGVILLDAPRSLGRHIQKAVAEVTTEPIVKIVYSHTHVDHIGGIEFLKNIANLEIIAEKNVSDFLKEKQDARRLVPTKTFVGKHTLEWGTAKIELRHGNYHSDEGDLFIYIPGKKFLMVIDSITPGYVPFMDLDLTSNAHNYLKVFDQMLKYDFDVLVPGHLTHLATREDVVTSKEYVLDVYKTVKRIHDGTDQMKIMSDAAVKYTWDNKFALFRIFLDGIIKSCGEEVKARWINKLAGVDVWADSHCRAMLIYARWDD